MARGPAGHLLLPVHYPSSGGTDATVTPGVVTATGTALTVTISTGSTVSAAVVTANRGVLVPTIATGSTVVAVVVTATGSEPAPSVSAGTNATVTPAVVTATAGALAPALSTGSTVTVAVVTATGSTPAPGVSTGTNVTVTPGVVTALFEALAPSFSTDSNISVVVVTVVGDVPVPTIPAAAGGLDDARKARSMTTGRYNWDTVTAGDEAYVVFDFEDEDGVPVTLEGTYRSQVRTGRSQSTQAPVVTPTLEVDETSITLTLTPEMTRTMGSLPNPRFFWDLEETLDDGTVTTLLDGYINIRGDVTV